MKPVIWLMKASRSSILMVQSENYFQLAAPIHTATHLATMQDLRCPQWLKEFDYSLSQPSTQTKHKIKITETMENAETIIFLGFGYHRQNIDLLHFPKTNGSLRRVTGTAYGLSQQSQEITKDRLCRAFGIDSDIIHLQDQTCEQLMDSERQALIDSQTSAPKIGKSNDQST